MASAELDHIRALLIAQTAAPDPAPRGLFGRLSLGKRRAPPPPLNLAPAPRPRFDPGAFADTDQTLLLEQICGPSEASRPLDVETASPLPPPAPRNGFGRRPDQEAELELVLDRPADAARRLRVLDPTGQAIGEMLFHPQAPVVQIVPVAHVDEAHAAPFFPEDLMETGSLWGPAPPDQPMRPWIKALRNSGAQVRAEPPNRKAKGKKAKAAKAPPPLPPVDPPSLGADLLEALALTLGREHDALCDRLMALDLFRAGPV
ncbi:MAG: hypothetical protein M3N05_01535 [Pseudomonadota bacterium]|nr:hypothetical protein [Pseudomonadota bacterium]